MPVNLSPLDAATLAPIAGVRLGIAQAGVRKANRDDLTVLLLDPGASVAGVFTQNRFCAAPVQVCIEHLAHHAEQALAIRALVINTGNANAGTGLPGLLAARETCAALAAELQGAGDTALDPCWRMPLDEEYDEALKSSFADMANVGPRAGGAITAAMFLKRFAGKYAWAHLDIAGTAWKSGAAKGGTGRPVPLLTHFVLGRAA
jgi:hypothetical protein